MSAEHYIPLSEANTGRIRTTLTLPYHMEEEVGLNVKRTELLCQLGGIRSLSIKNNNNRPTPVIVGVTNQGSALAGFAATESLVKFQNTSDSRGIRQSACWSDLAVSMNSDEIRIKLDIEKKDVKDPKNWSKVIDISLKDSIASASFQNLVERKALTMGYALSMNAMLTTFMIIEIMQKNVPGMAYTFFNWQFIVKSLDSVLYETEKPGRGKRWSLSIYEFPELDRKFVLDSFMLFSKLAKEIEK